MEVDEGNWQSEAPFDGPGTYIQSGNLQPSPTTGPTFRVEPRAVIGQVYLTSCPTVYLKSFRR